MAITPTPIQVQNEFTVEVLSGDKSSMTFNNHGDLSLANPTRQTGSGPFRALSVGTNGSNQLVVNYATDFGGGVQLNGALQLQGLAPAPKGTATVGLVIDAKGYIYSAS
jgi:hypothetical protein